MTLTQAARMASDLAYQHGHTCPWCGGKLEIVVDGFVGVASAPACFGLGEGGRERMVPKAFTACSACEFATLIET